MVSIKNVEKFVKDHPIFFSDGDEIVAAAKAAADEDGIISGAAVKGFMGRFTAMFFFEIMQNKEHLQIGMEELARLARGQNA